MNPIEQIVRERTGLDPASIGAGTIERAAESRMHALGPKARGDYARLVQASRTEWIELLELVVVAETWFYRDREPFEAVARLARTECLASRPTGRMRILSVPCASGEEPYSIAMALLDAGIARDRFEVDAADISPRAIARARNAIYGRNSFRGNNLDFRKRHFRQCANSYSLNAIVREAVRFFEANLLSPDFFAGQQYDFVFCRNLLMYFDEASRIAALNALHRLLGSAGILVVGAAEQSLAVEHGFVSANLPNAFAYRKRSAARRAGAREGDIPVSRKSALGLVGDARTSPARQRTASPPGTSASRALDVARKLADSGELQQARIVCEAHLRTDNTSVQGWYLLGLLRDAVTDGTAIECYRRALYLDPNHYGSLIQMALRSEQDGDLSRARLFRDRAQRAQNRTADL